jgi:hypothetical protein
MAYNVLSAVPVPISQGVAALAFYTFLRNFAQVSVPDDGLCISLTSLVHSGVGCRDQRRGAAK